MSIRLGEIQSTYLFKKIVFFSSVKIRIYQGTVALDITDGMTLFAPCVSFFLKLDADFPRRSEFLLFPIARGGV